MNIQVHTGPRHGMKARTIKSVIRKKVNDWLESIDDEEVRKVAEKNTIVTGGAIASMLLGETVNDFDLYFRTMDAAKIIAEYYVKRFKENPPTKHKGTEFIAGIYVREEVDRVKIVIQSAGIASEDGADDYQYFEGVSDENAAAEYVEKTLGVVDKTEEAQNDKPPYRPVFLSANAISLSNKMQLVIRFFGEPDEIHKNYDFVHCTSYWCSWNGELVLRPEAMQALLARELVYIGSKYPLCSIIRTRKFIKRGWSINAGQYLKMAMQLDELDLTNLQVLEEQLIGVDVFYFMEVLEKLKEQDPEKVNRAYLMEIIDRIF